MTLALLCLNRRDDTVSFTDPTGNVRAFVAPDLLAAVAPLLRTEERLTARRTNDGWMFFANRLYPAQEVAVPP